MKCLLPIVLLVMFSLAHSCQAADINEDSESSPSYTETPFIFEHLDLGPVLDLSNSLAEPEDNHYRTQDVKHAGYYYMPPGVDPLPTVDSSDIQFIKDNVEKYLASEYFDDKIFTMVQSYYIPWFDRKEFFFIFKSNGVPMRISGWYDKFVHIIVDADFDSKDSFLKQATRFFNLPAINKKDIAMVYNNQILSDGRKEFFVSYNNQDESDFRLDGYTILKAGPPGKYDDIDKTVLDLTIYPVELKDEK